MVDTRSVRLRTKPRGDDGFTLVELMVAMLVLAIVLTALVPVFYGTMRATASSRQRNVAISLAVKANEQIRSLPYWEIGYGPANTTPPACSPPSGETAVTLSSAGPMNSMPTTETEGGNPYSLLRCVYWANEQVNSTTTDTGAYVESVVTVTWTDNTGTKTATETSDIYPGGETQYSNDPYNNFAPAQSTGTGTGPATGSPQDVTFPAMKGQAATDSIDIQWSAPSGAPASTQYVVEYNTSDQFVTGPSGIYSTSSGLYATSPLLSALDWTAGGLAPHTTYWFRVVAVYNGAASSPTAAQSATTAGTMPATCQIYSLVANPNAAVTDTYGYLQGEEYITLAVNTSLDCTTGSGVGASVWVYDTTAGDSIAPVQMTGSQAMMNNVVGNGCTAWGPGNHTFAVYVGQNGATPTPYTPAAIATVNVTQTQTGTGACTP
jgi:prepilin-type N-terminal cleavage/methylation domain-containing protein